MSAELEQQLTRFAEALDREAPAISVDEILGRGTVAVDVNHLEGPTGDDHGSRVTTLSWGDAGSRRDMNGDRNASIELAPTAAEPPTRRRVALKVALAAAAAAVFVVALGAVVRIGDEADPADVPTSTVPTPPRPTTPAPTEPATSGGMWPQSTLEEVRAAQQRADAGDPDYTWQIGTQLTEDDPWAHVDELELVDRFMREVLGWESYIANGWEGGDLNASIGGTDGWVDGALTDQRFLRCAPGRTNPLYPPGPESVSGELCAPTIDDLRYESVSLDLGQPDRQDSSGIWVVKRWRLTAPFAQADPVAAEAQARERLSRFLAARIAGEGAEGQVQTRSGSDVPLLYATSSGAPYERYEIDRVDGPDWPNGRATFRVRLFADGDATVVEQQLNWDRSQSGGLWLPSNTTTENGRTAVVPYASADGEVSVSAPSTWETYWPGVGVQANVWFGILRPGPEPYREDGESIEFTDPVAYDAWCAANGGSPLLTAPADAASIAQQLVADPNFETTAPVAARIGGVEALAIDVALAPGGEACGIGMIEISRWVHSIGWDPGLRLRLYLVDLPQAMSVDTLAITVVAPEERFDDVIAETAPIIESIEFHTG